MSAYYFKLSKSFLATRIGQLTSGVSVLSKFDLPCEKK